MKTRKLGALAAAALLAFAVLTGCTSSETVIGGADSETDVKITDSSSSAAAESESSVSKAENSVSESGSTQEFATLGEYLVDPDVKAEIDASIAEQTDDNMTIQVYADGNTLVYEYQFADQYDFTEDELKTVKDSLKSGCDEAADTFTGIAQSLEDEVGLSDISIRLVYLNGDGSEIYTHEYN